MKRSIMSAVVAVLLIILGLPRQAMSACANPNGTLNTTYGWLSDEGLLGGSNGKTPKIGDFVPFAQFGSLTFDGNGNVSGSHDTNLGGLLIPHVDSGTYNVNSDCATGTIFLTSNGFMMSFVITSGGQEIKYVSATTGGVNSGALRLVATTPCSVSTLSGYSYGYAAHGLVIAGNGNGYGRVGGYYPFADAGQISFQADGSLSGIDNVNFGGVVTPGLPIVGTYTVNVDCTGSTTMTVGGVDQSLYFVVLQSANQVMFGATPNGLIWSGTMTKF